MKKEYKDTEEYKILDELIAQYIDEDTNSNELAWAMGYDKPLTEEQIQASMISKKYKGGN
jgi:hypothetical protein